MSLEDLTNFPTTAVQNNIIGAKKGLRKTKSDIMVINIGPKLDDSFPTDQFQIKSFIASFRYGTNEKGSAFLLYIREDIDSRLLISKSECSIQTVSVEINL